MHPGHMRKRNVHIYIYTKEQIMSFLDIYPLTFFVDNNFKKNIVIQGQKFLLLLFRILWKN